MCAGNIEQPARNSSVTVQLYNTINCSVRYLLPPTSRSIDRRQTDPPLTSNIHISANSQQPTASKAADRAGSRQSCVLVRDQKKFYKQAAKMHRLFLLLLLACFLFSVFEFCRHDASPTHHHQHHPVSCCCAFDWYVSETILGLFHFFMRKFTKLVHCFVSVSLFSFGMYHYGPYHVSACPTRRLCEKPTDQTLKNLAQAENVRTRADYLASVATAYELPSIATCR
mgnify:CR=1 FL=1